MIDPKNRDDFIKKLSQPYHYYIIHWEALRLVDELQSLQWYHVIADEAHRAKNRKAQQTQALKKINTRCKTALSGTPADNKPQDLYSILQWLYPRVWTSYWRFEHYFIKTEPHNQGPCAAEGCNGYHQRPFRKQVGVANVEELLESVEQYYLRRLKEDVIADLPDKYYTEIEVTLSPRQRKIYEQMAKDMLAWIGKHEEEPVAAPIVMAQLVRLKQFALAYAEIEMVTRRRRECPEDGCEAGCIGHEVRRVKLSEPSSKLDVVMERLEDNPTEQFVVFSESKQIINMLAARLTKANITHVALTGDTPQADRGGLVDDFQAGKARVFAGTIHAGGEGITLTAASTVIFLDRTWNPSRNRQAEDRLHRIGQKNAVEVIDIVATDTVDGGRLQQLEMKWSWLKELLGDRIQEEARDASLLAS
jgi:SNF2 family DNA or RNA helicase